MKTKDLSPNFFILGAAKAGSSSLYHYLKQHPQIFLPREKEVSFFIDDCLIRKGRRFYIRKYFSRAVGFPARGEATPFYFHRPEVVIPRMKEFYRENTPKFIILLRDPVKRAWSHYRQMVHLTGLETLPFDQALAQETERLARKPLSWFGYFSDGLYGQLLETWFSQFPRERFFVRTLDQLSENPHRVLKDAFGFLGVNDEVAISDVSIKGKAGVSRSKLLMKIATGNLPGMGIVKRFLPVTFRRRLAMQLHLWNIKQDDKIEKMDPSLASELRKKYLPDIERTETLLHCSLAGWKQG